jgi:microsomal dipeptidase-like Zn-dependent dipeptidase
MSTRRGRLVWWIVAVLIFLILLGFLVAPGFVGRRMNRTLDGASGPVSEEARRVHERLTVLDLHSDALLWDRDLLARGWGHVDVPRLIEGRVAVQAFTTVTKTPRDMNIESNTGDSDNITSLAVLQAWPVRTWGSLVERALHQARKLERFAADSRGRLAVIRSRGELRLFLRLHDQEPGVTAGFLGIEGVHALEGDLANVDRLFEAGFRMFGLTHFFDNEAGGSVHGVDRQGLSPFGRQVLARMQELGILVDVAHASPALIDDVLSLTYRPVVVSHSGVRGTCDNQRNLDDAQLVGIAATGGVVAIGLWETALCGETPAAWARAVRHAVGVMGVDHVALGSDWDGAVEAVVDASQTVHLTAALLDEGFTEEDIRKIMGGNVTRVLLATLPRDPVPYGDSGPPRLPSR